MVDRPRFWHDYPVGVDQEGQAVVKFTKREWDIPTENLIGKHFSEVIPLIIKESRFCPTRFQPPSWIGNYFGGVISAHFSIYDPKPHEKVGEIRINSAGRFQSWAVVDVDSRGNFVDYNPLEDKTLEGEGLTVGLGSRVMLNNLSVPGSFGGWAHIPMLDIIKPVTEQNVTHLIQEVKARCGLEKFLVLESSEKGMMILGLEYMDEANFLVFLHDALKMNHFEMDNTDIWIDDRWVAHCLENFREELGLPNALQVCGILRAKAVGSKPEPVVIASSF